MYSSDTRSHRGHLTQVLDVCRQHACILLKHSKTHRGLSRSQLKAIVSLFEPLHMPSTEWLRPHTFKRMLADLPMQHSSECRVQARIWRVTEYTDSMKTQWCCAHAKAVCLRGRRVAATPAFPGLACFAQVVATNICKQPKDWSRWCRLCTA